MMEHELSDRVALVTGSSRGIGLEIARTLALRGARVALCARNRGELDKAKADFDAMGAECLCLAADLEKPSAAARMVKAVEKKWGRLDILVNNLGGIQKTGKFIELSDAAWDGVYRLNIMSVVRFCRAAIPLLQRSRTPRIINISSMVALQPGSYNPHYSAMKAALLNLTKHLAGVLASDGILVNSITPGVIQTEGWEDFIVAKAQAEKLSVQRCRARENRRACKHVPLKRLGRRDEVAELVAFLASDRAGYITGANHRIDGGRVQSMG